MTRTDRRHQWSAPVPPATLSGPVGGVPAYQPLYQLHAGGNGQCSETWSAIHNLPEGTTIFVEVWLTGNSGDPYYGLKQYSYLNDH